MSFKITDSYGRIIYRSESDLASGAAEVAEQLEELICEMVHDGRPSYFIVSSVEDPAELDGTKCTCEHRISSQEAVIADNCPMHGIGKVIPDPPFVSGVTG